MVKLCAAAGCNTNNKVRFKKKKLLADKNNTFSFSNKSEKIFTNSG